MQIKITHPLFLSVATISILFFSNPIASDPQTNLLDASCSLYDIADRTAFTSSLNSTFAEIHSQLNSTKFTAKQLPPVYALFQCRDYLSNEDCTACFETARLSIRNCSGANGGRVIYDGCFLRYEINGFFDETTATGSMRLCSDETVREVGGFREAVEGLLKDLRKATPRIEGYFAAAKKEVAGTAVAAVYGVAQCAHTVSKSGCGDCLEVAYRNIRGCPPDGNGRSVDAGCFLRYSDEEFFSNHFVMDLSPFLQTGAQSNKKAFIGGGVGGAAFILLIIFLFTMLWRLKKTKKTQNRHIMVVTELRGPVSLSYSDLKSATGNFSEANKLGEGGFGGVYKGVMKNGNIVAVKKLIIRQSNRAEAAQADFESEVKLISNVHHRNIVRMLGWCSNGPELLLVYEYMANSSLDKFLFGHKHGILNWKQRFDIIVGTARGLAYMHEEFHTRIIHRDIKSSNILLDDDFQPKIADFGLARLLPSDQSHLSTRVAGTLGYTAPEYAMRGQLSEKADTYSYGVVVLEIISGRRSNEIRTAPVFQYLLEWAWTLHEDESWMELVDKRLDPSEYRPDEMKKVIEIALMCTQSVASRPTMSEVVVLLLRQVGLVVNLTRPTFIGPNKGTLKKAPKDTSNSTSSSTSNATMSVTEITAR